MECSPADKEKLLGLIHIRENLGWITEKFAQKKFDTLKPKWKRLTPWNIGLIINDIFVYAG